MPAGQGKDAERFAAAVEQGTPPGFAGDDDLARELEIVAMLRSRGAALAPDPDAKARAKERLMAMLAADQPDRPGGGPRPPVAPPSAQEQTVQLARVLEPVLRAAQEDTGPATAQLHDTVTEPEAVTTTTTTSATRPGRSSSRHSVLNRPGGRSRGSRGPAATGGRRRGVLVGSAALVMMLALTGGGIFASRDALPGDQLYAIKRVAESAGVALTLDDTTKARRHLDIASTRLQEVEQLVARDPQAPVRPDLFATTIQEFDTATGEGSRILLAEPDDGSTAALGDLRTWATEQADRLASVRPALPVPAAADVDGAMELLDRLRGRTEALTARSSCTEVTSGTADDLGPLPAVGTCAPRPVDPDARKPGTRGTDTQRSNERSPAGTTQNDPEAPSSTTVSGTPSPDEPPSLLPETDPDGTPPDGRGSLNESDEDPTSTTTTRRAPQDGSSVPLPLLPPITLPPLLPGMPGITIG